MTLLFNRLTYLFIGPLNSYEVVEVDGISLSRLVLEPSLEVGAECIQWGTSKVNQIIRQQTQTALHIHTHTGRRTQLIERGYT